MKVVKSYLRVNIEAEFFSSVQKSKSDFVNYDQINKFPASLVARAITIFQCVSLWRESQFRNITHATRDEIELWTEGGFETMLAGNFIEPAGDSFVIIGNRKQLKNLTEWRQQKIDAGTLGAEKRWAKERIAKQNGKIANP